MTPTLNAFQAETLRRVLEEHQQSEEIAAAFDSAIGPVHKLSWFPCEVPGAVAVETENGYVLHVLLPTPRPVNRDPMFQKPTPINRVIDTMALQFVSGRRDFYQDWQWGQGACMDAPNEMPAGACEYFAADEEAFGAHQMTCYREPW